MPNFNLNHSHHLLLPRLTVDSSSGMKLLFSIRILRELANKFSLFFLPVFLFQLGQANGFFSNLGLTDFQGGIGLLSLYLAGSRLMSLLLAFPAGNFIRKYGFSAALMLSHLLYAVMLISLRMSLLDFRWLLLALVTDGVSTVLMWGSFNTLFSKNAREMHMGSNLGLVQALLNIIWLIAPALSGIVIFLLGYEILFTVGLIIVGVVIILAAFVSVPHERDSISFKELAFWANDRRFVKLGVSISGKAFYDLAIFTWPLYIFLLLGNTERVGILYSLSFLTSVILSLFIGAKLDKRQRKKPFLFSGGVLSFLWLLRSQLVSFWPIVIVDAIDKLTGNFHWLFFDRVLLNRGKGREAFSYFIYREIITSLTGVIFWLAFILMFIFFALEWRGFFVLGAMGALLSLLVSRRNKEDLIE